MNKFHESVTEKDFLVSTLGNSAIPSPLNIGKVKGDGLSDYVGEDERVLFETSLKSFLRCKESNQNPVSFEKAGPREKIFFEPAKTKAAVVTCGGLCPGLNNVIRGLVMEMHYRYGIRRVVGIRYGFEGFIPSYGHPFIDLTPGFVDDIHLFGGSVLGSSRGDQDVSVIVDTLENQNINILFCIGGDGTLRGANAITEEIKKRNLKIAVACVPKTIDNDILFIERSFGFETAFSIARDIIRDAHNEAEGAFNGVSITKLMGRDSGFIAAHAALSMQEVNAVIIPEMVDFTMEGENGFLEFVLRRLHDRHHMMIIVAEGAGQNLFAELGMNKDKSGNQILQDIGVLLKGKIGSFLTERNVPFSIKYIDPSYIIRSAPANANDSMFCGQLAQNAVHGAMAGKTGFVAGIWNSVFTYVPITQTILGRKKIDIESELWWNVLESTGQPVKFS
ncbi:MAG: ATP-dependent 6-phosphofructokinase [Bacteroidota bacterium]